MTETVRTVVLNGEKVDVRAPWTVGRVVSDHSATRSGIAVALNSEVVPRSSWDSVVLSAGDVLDLVTAKQGG